MVLPISDRFWCLASNGGHAFTMTYPAGAAACVRHDVILFAGKELSISSSACRGVVLVVFDDHGIRAKRMLRSLDLISRRVTITLHCCQPCADGLQVLSGRLMHFALKCLCLPIAPRPDWLPKVILVALNTRLTAIFLCKGTAPPPESK